MDLADCTPEGVSALLKQIKPHSSGSAGPDGITAWMLTKLLPLSHHCSIYQLFIKELKSEKRVACVFFDIKKKRLTVCLTMLS